MNYRILNPEEWPMLAPIFNQYGAPMPHPQISKISIGAINGKADAFLCLQPIWHVEPAWVARHVRGQVDFTELTRLLVEDLPKGSEYFAFAPDQNMERIIAEVGLKKMPYSVWKGIA